MFFSKWYFSLMANLGFNQQPSKLVPIARTAVWPSWTIQQEGLPYPEQIHNFLSHFLEFHTKTWVGVQSRSILKWAESNRQICDGWKSFKSFLFAWSFIWGTKQHTPYFSFLCLFFFNVVKMSLFEAWDNAKHLWYTERKCQRKKSFP